MDSVETTMRGAAALGRRVKLGTAPMPTAIIAFQIPGPSAATIAMASRICGEPRSGEAFGRRPRRLAGILDLFQGSWVVAMVPHKRHMGRSSRERAPGGFAKGSEGCAESGTLGCSLRERHHGLPPSLGGEFTVPDTSCHAGVALTSCAVPRERGEHRGRFWLRYRILDRAARDTARARGVSSARFTSEQRCRGGTAHAYLGRQSYRQMIRRRRLLSTWLPKAAPYQQFSPPSGCPSDPKLQRPPVARYL